MYDDSTKSVMVVPTYNEAHNIMPLLESLERAIPDGLSSGRITLLFVDGNSPDGTAEQIRNAALQFSNVHLIVEQQKGGIGQAYITGFQYAMERLGADIVIEFDADLQHPPETIPVLIDRIAAGADLVIGSRKIRGGGYPDRWDRGRLCLSRIGGFVARVLLFAPRPCFFKVTDPTSGLRATRVKGVLDRIDLDTIKARGFAYKLELLHRLSLITPKIVEIPLRFRERLADESKITSQTGHEIFSTALRLRRDDPWTRRFLKFAVVGGSGVVVNALFLEFFRQSGVFRLFAAGFENVRPSFVKAVVANESAWAAAASAEVSIISNFLLNSAWTFRGGQDRSVARFFRRAVLFNLTSIGAIVIQFAAIGTATFLMGDTAKVRLFSLIFTVLLLVVPYNWLIYKRVIWKGV